jgi:T5SS/PEP-CTERM-associated repeat protein
MAVRLPAILLALVFLASTADFSFAQTLWNAGVEDWSASGNWTLGAPGAITDAQINNGGTAQILAPGALAFNVTLGATPLSIGSLAVQGGHAQFTSVLAVGAFGSGALNITEGGSISNIHGRFGRELGGDRRNAQRVQRVED